MNNTKIEWTEATWNPSAGCSKISAGCKNCYAETMANRLQAMDVLGYENGFGFSLVPERLEQPLTVKKPTKFFVNSMSDLFHEDMPSEYLDKIFDVIKRTPQHTYQILTKRAERMATYLENKNIPQNIWLGVTVENQEAKSRIDFLRELPAKIRFISMEPLLEDIGDIDFTKIDWVIVGGESGPKARIMKEHWAVNIKEQADKQNIAFFFKQWGTWGADGQKRNKKLNGRRLEGKIYDAYPAVI